MSKRKGKIIEVSPEESCSSKSRKFSIESLLIVLTLAISTILFMWESIFSTGLFPGDSSDFLEMPIISQIESFNLHQFPLWNNLWVTGFPEYASPISALYDPLITIPYLLFGMVNGGRFIVISHVFFAGVCFFLFSTTVTSKRSLQLYGSILFMFSGTLVGRIEGGHTELLTTQMFIPLSLYFINKATSSKNIVFVIASAISISMFIFGGGTFYFAFFMMMYAIYFIFNVFSISPQNKLVLDKQNFMVLSLLFLFTLMFSAIKLLPAMLVGSYIVRIDPIDVFVGSGYFRNIFTSFVTGSTISGYGGFESYSYLGLIPFSFAIVSLLDKFNDKLFYYISFAIFLLWAAGKYTFFSFIHIMPFLENFRVPGRSLLFASFIVIALSLYGFEWFLSTYNSDRIKMKPLVAMFSLFLFFEFQGQIISYLEAGNLLLLFRLFILAVFVAAISYYLFNKESGYNSSTIHIAVVLIFFSVFMVTCLNVSSVEPHESILDNSTPFNIAQQIKAYDANEHEQPWVLTNGWAYFHMDYAYYIMKNSMHMQHSYYGYFLKDMPYSVQIGNTSYYTANYVVDTQFLDSNESFGLPTIFEVDGVGVHKVENSLPNVFVVRNYQVIPIEIEYFTPNKVTVDGSSILPGDILIYKNAYYKGWKVNGENSVNIGNMVGYNVIESSDTFEFSFQPTDFKVGLSLTTLALFIFVLLILKRDKVNSLIRDGA